MCIDTVPFIYFIEKDPKYLNIVRQIFAEIDVGKIDAITSTITLLEVLVLPFKTKNESLAEKYRKILLYAEGLTTFEIFHEVSELSAKLRAKYSIRTPDAIQIAVGIIYGADTFLTNDSSLKKVEDIRVVILEDFLEK
ncbi:MAG: type II toxin-antitoxin system VapC family toxin [Thermodesulfobacteriota bacterium]|nr:type II toxin-antitoxin system VapC family toxin [Thermodesulfobacteriota bacterium]